LFLRPPPGDSSGSPDTPEGPDWKKWILLVVAAAAAAAGVWFFWGGPGGEAPPAGGLPPAGVVPFGSPPGGLAVLVPTVVAPLVVAEVAPLVPTVVAPLVVAEVAPRVTTTGEEFINGFMGLTLRNLRELNVQQVLEESDPFRLTLTEQVELIRRVKELRLHPRIFQAKLMEVISLPHWGQIKDPSQVMAQQAERHAFSVIRKISEDLVELRTNPPGVPSRRVKLLTRVYHHFLLISPTDRVVLVQDLNLSPHQLGELNKFADWLTWNVDCVDQYLSRSSNPFSTPSRQHAEEFVRFLARAELARDSSNG
jgi:hypothetical protein